MKKLFIFIILSLVPSAYCLVPSPISAHSSIQVIKMTPKTFEPSNVTVDENSTIIFLNQDEISRWPASNLHPTHEIYPEFDPKREIKPGESWSFKTKKPGTWNFHDHLDPHLRGTITVAAEDGETVPKNDTSINVFESVKKYLASLLGKIGLLFSPKTSGLVKPEEFNKLTPEEQFDALGSLAKSKGGEETWKFVTEIYKGEAGSSGNIHDLAHLAGKLIFEEKGIAGIGSCTSTFAFGCYHGLLDAAFQTSLNDLAKAEKECEKVGAVNSGPYGSCVHGIGHGVASYHESRNLENSLEDCNRLTNGQNFCHDGVLMEFARSADENFYSNDNLLYPCDQLEKDYGQLYSTACGRNQPPVLMGRFKLTLDQIAQLCTNATLSDQFKSACVEALGFSLASTQDATQIIKGCQIIKNPHFSGLCFKAAAGELIFQDAQGWPEKSKQICGAAPAAYQAPCHENSQKLMKEYGRQAFNMLDPGQDESEYVRSQMRVCYENGGKDDCYKNVAQIFSDQFPLKKTLSLFATNEDYPEIYARCHEATHYLSRNEYQKLGSIPQVYAQCDSTCHGGCYHGVLEQYLKDKNLASDGLYREFPKVCGTAEDFDKPLVFNECQHGMGHAAMFVTDTQVRDSLALCDTLTTQDAQERCYGGVFMENSSSSTNNDHPGRYVKEDDPYFPCNELPERYSRLCWRYQSSHFALITNHDWQETAKLCLGVPKEYQDDCFRTIGTNQVGFTQDTVQMRKNCGLMPNEHFEETCLQGVISSFAYRFVGDLERMESFCTSAKGKFQEPCFRQVGTAVIDWVESKEAALLYCHKIKQAKFSSWCKEEVN